MRVRSQQPHTTSSLTENTSNHVVLLTLSKKEKGFTENRKLKDLEKNNPRDRSLNYNLSTNSAPFYKVLFYLFDFLQKHVNILVMVRYKCLPKTKKIFKHRDAKHSQSHTLHIYGVLLFMDFFDSDPRIQGKQSHPRKSAF